MLLHQHVRKQRSYDKRKKENEMEGVTAKEKENKIRRPGDQETRESEREEDVKILH